MIQENQQLYEFGAFLLDARGGVLRRGAERIPLSPKVFEILCLLVEQQGAVISKEELMRRVWADSFVEESNLTQSIYTLRRALGKENQNFIENVPRRGYRFAAPVRVVSEEPTTAVNLPPQIQTAVPAEKLFAELAENLAGEENQKSKIERDENQKSKIKNRQFVLLAAGAFVILLFAAIAAARFLPPQSAAPAQQQSPLERVSFEKLTFTGDVSYPVIAPDGASFAFVRDGSLFVQDVKSGNHRRLDVAGHKIFGYLQFSSDGETVYFRNQRRFDLAGEVFAVGRAGGAAAKIADNAWGAFSFSPDGSRFAFYRFYPATGEFALLVRDTATGAERELVRRKPPDSFYSNGAPAWTADNQKIAIVFQNQQRDYASTLVTIEEKSGKASEIPTPRLKQIEHAAWLPGGEALIIAGRENYKFFQLWRVSPASGELQKITNDTNIYRGLSVSADGKNLLARQFSLFSHIWVAAADNLENPKQLTFGNLNRDGHSGLTWTPAGEIVHTARITGDIDLWRIRPETGEPRHLTTRAGDTNEQPFATPDGKYIFYNSTKTDGKHIWRMDAANGANQTQITTSETDIEFSPTVSPDGIWLYYLRKGRQNTAIERKSLVDGATEQLAAPPKFAPGDGALSLSPDGKFLAFQNLTDENRAEAGKQILQICVLRVDGAKEEPRFFQIAASSPLVRWTSDGAAFDYLENAGGEARIWRQSLNEKDAPKLILRLPDSQIFDFAWSADGKHLALSRGKQQNDVMRLTNFNP